VSAIDLVLLGLLTRREKSAYDLAREIERYDLDGVVRLSIAAIYKNVRRLEADRLLTRRETRRGDLPEKTMYTITPEGRERFFALMEKYAAEPVRYRFDFNAVVLSLDRVPKKRRERLLGLLKIQLDTGHRAIEQSLKAWGEQSESAGLILRQVELVSRALGEWIEGALAKR
jgi:DNA-binding PadR family transcriptional regulator